MPKWSGIVNELKNTRTASGQPDFEYVARNPRDSVYSTVNLRGTMVLKTSHATLWSTAMIVTALFTGCAEAGRTPAAAESVTLVATDTLISTPLRSRRAPR
jgi:hypothetical protein